MSDKIERYNEIYTCLWNNISNRGFIQPNEPDSKVEQEAASFIRELRQIIERLRRIVDDGEPLQQVVRSMQDAMKLPKDELAFLAGQFSQWINNDEGCPARDCVEFPCEYRCIRKAECEENLKNGDLDEVGMKEQQDNGFFADFCEGDQQGCWAEYYLWCYRNGVNPLNGKKEAK